MQALQSQLSVLLAPLADGHGRQTHALGDRWVGVASTKGQHNLGALDERVRQGARAGDALKLLDLVLTEDQRWHRTTKRPGERRRTIPILIAIYGTAR